jgi:hypothetical protein
MKIDFMRVVPESGQTCHKRARLQEQWRESGQAATVDASRGADYSGAAQLNAVE